MAKRKRLTDRTLKALKPMAGKLYDVMDSDVRGLGVRVSETGRLTFVLVARFPGSKNPTRRALGEYGALTLEKARAKARDWLELLRKGVDPREDEDRKRIEQQRRRANSFRVVCEEYIRLAVIGPNLDEPKQRKGIETKRDLEKEFIARWGAGPSPTSPPTTSLPSSTQPCPAERRTRRTICSGMSGDYSIGPSPAACTASTARPVTG